MGVADGVDGGCACSGGAKTAGGGSGGGGDAAAAAAVSNGNNARVARQHSSGPVTNGASPDPSLASEASVALTGWLANLGLGAYESQLVSQGFDTLEAMGTATEPDLEAMGFKKGHLRLLLARAPSASAMSGSGSGGGGGGGNVGNGGNGIESRMNVGGSAAAVSRGRSTPPMTTAAVATTRGISVRNEVDNPIDKRKTTAVRFAARSVEATIDEQEQGEEGEGEGGEGCEDQYCNASALQPSRALSLGGDAQNNNGGGGGGDGFKELKPEEMEIDNVIGEGSFGVVRRARWRGMDVAVKELKNCTAYAAAAAAAAGTGAGAGAADGGATAGAGVSVVVGRGGGGGGFVTDLTDGQEDMRHEARMLAKGG